ncbi:MAG: hypothetical protein MST10_05205 [Lentisphaeria bacterium]|nr:hypothetical protein [Lentisphaeria bacterium]
MNKLLQKISGLKNFVIKSEEISHWKYCSAIALIAAILFSGVISATNVASAEEFVTLGNMMKMAATGDYVTPRCGETVFMLNATLHTICGAWCIALLGNTVFAAALPALLSAIFFMLLIYFIACRLGLQRLTAFATALILGFNTTFFSAAQQASAQMSGSLWLTLAWWSFGETVLSRRRRVQLVWYLVFILAGTLLLLTMNLSAGVLLGMPLLIWLMWLDWREDCFRWRRFTALLLGSGVMLLGYVGYLAWLYQAGGYYTAYSVLWGNNVFSIVGARSNPEGIGFWYDYLKVIWRFFMPFLPFFLVVLIYDFKLCRQNKSPVLSLILSVFIISVLILQLVPWKPERYLLILTAPAALLTAYGVENFLQTRTDARKYWQIALQIGRLSVWLLTVAALLFIGISIGYFCHSSEIDLPKILLALFSGLLFYGVIMMLAGWRHGKWQVYGRFATLVVALLAAGVFTWRNYEEQTTYQFGKKTVPLHKILQTHANDDKLTVLLGQPAWQGALHFFYNRELPELNDYYWPLDKEITIITLPYNCFVKKYGSRLNPRQVEIYPLPSNGLTGDCSVVFLHGKIPELLPALNLLFDGDNRNLINEYNDTALFYRNLASD